MKDWKYRRKYSLRKEISFQSQFSGDKVRHRETVTCTGTHTGRDSFKPDWPGSRVQALHHH